MMGFEVQGAHDQLRQKAEHVSVNLPGLCSSRQELLHHRSTSGSRARFRIQLAEHMAQLVQFINRYNQRRFHRIGVPLVDDEACRLPWRNGPSASCGKKSSEAAAEGRTQDEL